MCANHVAAAICIELLDRVNLYTLPQSKSSAVHCTLLTYCDVHFHLVASVVVDMTQRCSVSFIGLGRSAQWCCVPVLAKYLTKHIACHCRPLTPRCRSEWKACSSNVTTPILKLVVQFWTMQTGGLHLRYDFLNRRTGSNKLASLLRETTSASPYGNRFPLLCVAGQCSIHHGSAKATRLTWPST